MKNAMKKLMSLLLVAVLLVSAVPFAASATATETKDIYVTITIDGAVYSEGTKKLNTADTLESALAAFLPAGVGATYAPTYVREGSEVPSNYAVDANTNTIVVNLRTRTTTVTVQLGGKSGTLTPKVTESVTLNENLLASVGLYITEGNEIKSWTVNGVAYTNGATVAVAGGPTIVCVEGAKATSGSTDNNNTTTTEKQPIKLQIKHVEGGNVVQTIEKTPDGDSAVVKNMLTYWFDANWASNYTCTKVHSSKQGGVISVDASAVCGDTVTVVLVPKTSSGTTSNNTTDKNVSTEEGVYEEKPVVDYNKFPHNVYLNIYKDTLVGAADKTINITSGAALDGTVTMAEVKSIVMDYYSAKNSYGIGFDGLYLSEGTWVTNYVTDTQKYDEFINVDDMRNERTIYLNVMISNATSKTAYTADSSNPKTGDSIYTAMAVMGISASALAAVMYVYNKKRQAV